MTQAVLTGDMCCESEWQADPALHATFSYIRGIRRFTLTPNRQEGRGVEVLRRKAEKMKGKEGRKDDEK